LKTKFVFYLNIISLIETLFEMCILSFLPQKNGENGATKDVI